MERLIFRIGLYDVIAEHQSVYRFGIQHRRIEHIEFIFLYDNSFLISPVEILRLTVTISLSPHW